VSLAIETHVREDAIRLFGFTSEVERAWFRTLQTIQGVGAKVALAVLGTLSPQDLSHAIALANWAAVEQSPGVGKKLAQRIVAELKDKAPALSVAGLNVPATGRKGGPAAVENNAARPKPSRPSPTSATSRRRQVRPSPRPSRSWARRPIRPS
jgi:Holliday junction DNA helicase RuvA